MKFNWGTGIAIFYSSFVLIFLFVWYRSTQIDHTLVSDTYYQDDYQYQAKYDGMKNNLKNPLKIDTHDSENFVFKFPTDQKEIKGTIIFLRPSDKSKDFKMEVKVNENNEFSVPKSMLITGLWDLSVSWVANGESFFFKDNIIR